MPLISFGLSAAYGAAAELTSFKQSSPPTICWLKHQARQGDESQNHANFRLTSSGLETLNQAKIEQRNLLVFQIGSGQTARLRVMATLLNKAVLKSLECVVSHFFVTELFFLAFYFLRLGSLATWE